MLMASRRKHAVRPFGAAVVVAVALLASVAHPPSAHASTGRSSSSSPCVRVTSAALSSSCLPGADVEYFTFAMEGKAGADSAHHRDPETEDGATRAIIAARAGESIVPCTATDVTVTVGFAAPVISVAYPWGATISGASMVIFFVETLESNPTEFAVVLDTTGVAVGTNAVTYVSYSDKEGNFPDMSGLMTVASAAPECGRYAAATKVRRKLQNKEADDLYDDCDLCANLSSAQLEALDMYDNGGKEIVCDPTCLDGVSDPTHCNYFGLGQICRGCGDCSTCAPCPDTDKTPAPTPKLSTEPPTSPPAPADTPSPTPVPAVASTDPPSTRVVVVENDDDDDGDDATEFDCTPCTSLSDDQLEALTMYDRGGKKIVCDPTCLDGVSDPTHCNYFGLGQICRGCGTCPTCTPCP